MSTVDHLIEQHIRESEAHLRHIDEMLAKSQAARTQAGASAQQQSQLARIRGDHQRLSAELAALRKSHTPDAAERSKGIKAALQAVGLELEKTLTAIGDKSGL